MAELPSPPRHARGIAARGAPSFSPSRVECHPVGRRRHAGCSAEWHPDTGCASRYVLLAGYVQRLLLRGCQNYLLNRKEKPYEKRWSRAVLGRVSRGTFQRALKIRSWSLETTSCVSAPQLRSSGGSSCRTDPPLSTASCAALVGLQLFRVSNFSRLPGPPRADPPAQQHLVGM